MNYALVVGISHYSKRPLEGAAEDAKKFATWLSESKLVEDSNLHFLASETSNDIADYKHIDQALLKILKDAGTHENEKNRFYFYFSGHGIGVSYYNTGLCLRLWNNELPSYSISFHAYEETLINKGIFDEILIFLDCCRDYDFLIDAKKPNLNTSYASSRKTSLLICYSTIFGKKSYEIPQDPNTEIEEDANKKRGAFTAFLLEGLKGDADMDDDGKITGDDLLTHISANFKTYARKYNKEQDADGLVSADGRDIVICNILKNKLDYNYIITLTRKSSISIFDGSNSPVANFSNIDVEIGQELKVQLPKGLIKLKDDNTKEEKYFTNYNLNTLGNEQF